MLEFRKAKFRKPPRYSKHVSSDHPRSESGGKHSKDKASSRARHKTFKTSCAECGGETKVPFQPRKERPVFCEKCFSKNNPTNEKPFKEKSKIGGFKEKNQKTFKATCSECKQRFDLPFAPRKNKDVFCYDCFKNKRPTRDRSPKLKRYKDRTPISGRDSFKKSK